MVIGIFGESCTGKSSIADELSKRIAVKVYTGKDYIKLAKNELEAKQNFIKLLEESVESSDVIIYVISEKEHLSLLPPKAVRVLVTAELDIIKNRFAKRMNGNLPAPISLMLEKKHGMFDNELHDLHIEGTDEPLELICNKILELCRL